MGGNHYHLEVLFQDGIVWLARIRRFNASSPPQTLQDHVSQSEVATLKFLEKTSVPAPKVFDFAVEGPDNPVGVGFMLVEKLPGSTIYWSNLSPEQKRKVIKQLADIYIDLRKYPFDSMGCLHLSDVGHVGEFARDALTDFYGPQMMTVGRLDSVVEYHTAAIKLILKLILEEKLYTRSSVDAYLVHRLLLDLVPLVSPEPTSETPQFFLRHADDKEDHILVDKDFNITGMIDWEYAWTAPAHLAFNSPIMTLPVADFFDGTNKLGDDEIALAHIFEQKSYPDMAEAVRKGRVQHSFAWWRRIDFYNWRDFLDIFRAIRNAVGVDEELEWEEWRERAMERYGEEEELRKLIARADSSADT